MDERGPRVLYIDDDADARRLLANALALRGYEVRVAADGAQGLAELRREPADVILLDLRLRGMDGIEVCRNIKLLAGETFLPVIFLMAQTDVSEKVKALEGGGDDFCVKPVFLDELDARIRVLLRLRSRERRLMSETQKFRKIALIDPLTELGNRRAFDVELERAWARVERGQRPLALLMADIDRFKAFNDRYGHRTGDEVLKAVAKALAGAVRRGDSAYRFGGEEFVVLAPEASREGAVLIAERIRRAVSAEKVSPPPDSSSTKPLSFTVSLGLAVVPDPAIPTRAALIECADRALYDAKAAGRDRVVVAAATVSHGGPTP
jgi:diguanylate cyclase (GGDEF)-like protein